MAPTTRVGLSLWIVSASALLTEIMLTRLFSVVFWNHLAFLAVSVALFGSAAAALGYHFAQERLRHCSTEMLLTLACLGLSAAILLGEILVLSLPTHNDGSLGLSSLLLLFLAASGPFVAAGFAVCVALARLPEHASLLYFCDLGGAALGCLLVVPLLSLWGAPTALAVVSLLPVLAAVLLAWQTGHARKRLLSVCACLGTILLLAISTQANTGLLALRTAKGIELARLGIEFNRWNSFSLVTVFPQPSFQGWSLSPTWHGQVPEHKSLIIDMNALTALRRWQGDLTEAQFSLLDATAFAYRVRRPTGRVCIVGAGGGKDVLAALAAGAQKVVAVEINPLIVQDVMQGHYREYVGNLYNRPEVEARVEDGRHYLRTARESFEVIHLSMVDTSAATAAGAYALTENSVYTVEAFSEFLSHLTPDGVLTVSSVSLPNLSVGERLTWLARETLQRRGRDPARHTLVLTTPWLGLPKAVLHNVMVFSAPLSDEQIERARAEAAQLGFTLAWAPGQRLGEDPRSAAVEAILTLPQQQLEGLAKLYPLDVSPTTDDRPFFFYQNRLIDLAAQLGAPHPAHMFGNGGYFLARLVGVSLLVAAALLGLPLLFLRRLLLEGQGSWARDAAYFSCLGLGFLGIEMALIQRLMVFLGQPTYALVAVLFVLLAAGGVGSRLAARLSDRDTAFARLFPCAVVVLYLAVVWIGPVGNWVLNAAQLWSAPLRMAVAGLLLAPLGLALGMPLPLALQALATRAPQRVPWLWGINGAASVVGSLLATILAVHAGISAALLTGTMLYVVAGVLAVRVAARHAS